MPGLEPKALLKSKWTEVSRMRLVVDLDIFTITGFITVFILEFHFNLDGGVIFAFRDGIAH